MGWLQSGSDSLFPPEEPVIRAKSVVIANRVLERQADRAYIVAHLAELKTFEDVDPAH